MADIDLVRLNFDPRTLLVLNVVLGLVMYGVSLELKASDFRAAMATPRALVIGLLGHHVVFPAVTWLLVMAIEPRPSIALGMILVSSCPAGNISNFLTHFARGNTALSVSISTLSTLAAALSTVESEHLRPLEPAVTAINAQFDVITAALPGVAQKAAIVAERRPR